MFNGLVTKMFFLKMNSNVLPFMFSSFIAGTFIKAFFVKVSPTLTKFNRQLILTAFHQTTVNILQRTLQSQFLVEQ